MKIAINKCWGGFGLSHAAIMRYAEISGVPLYPFVNTKKSDGGTNFDIFEPYIGQKSYSIHYSTQPLKDDGKYEDNSYWYYGSLERNDPILIQVIEELGEKASGDLSKVVIKDIPDGIEYEIDDYDGMETIHEKHQSW